MKRNLMRLAWTAAVLAALCPAVFAQQMLIPVGEVVGLALEEGTVTVAAFDEECGGLARAAGIQIGDEILSVDGMEIDQTEDLHRALAQSDGTVELRLRRRGKEQTVVLSPAVTDQGPRLGIFLREGVTGIGTVTYYDPDSGTFGALGHGVSNSRGQLCQMRRGSVYRATVAGVKRGLAGQPGQLQGSVVQEEPMAMLTGNTSFGIFGQGAAWSGEALPVAQGEEIQPGQAQILSNVQGDEVEVFSVEILKVFHAEPSSGRDLLIQVTDPELLEITGGIVAGMSGSPIIQNGKLIGAVTHVLVNDPTTGYGIFIENMLEAADAA